VEALSIVLATIIVQEFLPEDWHSMLQMFASETAVMLEKERGVIGHG
jgi:hypothetical protein